jgi:dTMP kinase
MQKGKFIIFEGLDGSGKSTQCELLHIKTNSILINFPDRTTAVGKLIDKHLRGEISLNAYTLMTLFSANRWENAEKIKSALNSGLNVIADRYTFSGQAYAPDYLKKFLKKADEGLPEPDLVFFMNSSPEKCLQCRGEVLENIGTQKKAYADFARMSGPWIILNAEDTAENIHAAVLRYAITLLTSPAS